jgi:putative ATP-binding cassette transporter
VVSLVSFSIILWGVSGSIEVFGITIPGYMFWVRPAVRRRGQLADAPDRPAPDRFEQPAATLRGRTCVSPWCAMRENAESIALYNGEPNENQRLSARFGKVWHNFWDIMKVSKRLTFFTAGYSQIAIIFPFIVAAPRTSPARSNWAS